MVASATTLRGSTSDMKRVLALGAAALVAEKLVKRANALDLRGKRAVVTGGSRGLGFALARELRAQGAHVAICARGERQLYAAQAMVASVPRAASARTLIRPTPTIRQTEPALSAVCASGIVSANTPTLMAAPSSRL